MVEAESYKESVSAIGEAPAIKGRDRTTSVSITRASPPVPGLPDIGRGIYLNPGGSYPWKYGRILNNGYPEDSGAQS